MMAVAHSAPMASVGSNPGSNVTGFVSTVGTRTATNGGSEAPMSAKEKLQRAQKLFTDSHSSDMVERQVAAIMRICEQNQAGLLLQDLENLHPIVTLCNERIAQAEQKEFVEPLCGLVVTVFIAPQSSLVGSEYSEQHFVTKSAPLPSRPERRRFRPPSTSAPGT